MFAPHSERPRALLIGADTGLAPIVEFAQWLLLRIPAPAAFGLPAHHDTAEASWKPLVLLSIDVPCPFRPRPSTILIPGMPDGTIACHPSLDDVGIASRLASSAGYPGCFEGDVTELAAIWLGSLDASALDEVEIFACGPNAMLDAAAVVAQRFGVPRQLNRS